MLALYERKKTGVGRFVHTSLLEAQVFMLDFQASRYLMDGEVAGQAGNDHPVNIPMGVFPTADKPINIAASSPKLWDVFCRAADKPEWLEVPEWKTPQGRSKDRARVNAAVSEVTKTKPSASLDRHARGGRHPVRADQQHRRGLRRSAGEAPRAWPCRSSTGAGALPTSWARR